MNEIEREMFNLEMKDEGPRRWLHLASFENVLVRMDKVRTKGMCLRIRVHCFVIDFVGFLGWFLREEEEVEPGSALES